MIKCNNLVIIIKEKRGRNSDAPLKSHLKSVNEKYHPGAGRPGREGRRPPLPTADGGGHSFINFFTDHLPSLSLSLSFSE